MSQEKEARSCSEGSLTREGRDPSSYLSQRASWGGGPWLLEEVITGWRAPSHHANSPYLVFSHTLSHHSIFRLRLWDAPVENTALHDLVMNFVDSYSW